MQIKCGMRGSVCEEIRQECICPNLIFINNPLIPTDTNETLICLVSFRTSSGMALLLFYNLKVIYGSNYLMDYHNFKGPFGKRMWSRVIIYHYSNFFSFILINRDEGFK